jgi:hypothetical protein
MRKSSSAADCIGCLRDFYDYNENWTSAIGRKKTNPAELTSVIIDVSYCWFILS